MPVRCLIRLNAILKNWYDTECSDCAQKPIDSQLNMPHWNKTDKYVVRKELQYVGETTKTDVAKKKQQWSEFVTSVLRRRKSMWWKGLVKRAGFEMGTKEMREFWRRYDTMWCYFNVRSKADISRRYCQHSWPTTVQFITPVSVHLCRVKSVARSTFDMPKQNFLSPEFRTNPYFWR